MSLSLWNDPFFSYDPLREMTRELRRMDRELSRVLSSEDSGSSSSSSSSALSRNSTTSWMPRCDVTETEKDVVVHAELPGIQKENINIELKDNILTISGERKHEKKEENEKWHRTERSFGSFVRSMMVPDGVTQEQIKAKFDNGVLEVTFPKPSTEPKQEVKKIAIN